MCPRSIAGVPSSQALPGYLITAPPSVCVPDVIGVLAVWIQNQKKKTSARILCATPLHPIPAIHRLILPDTESTYCQK